MAEMSEAAIDGVALLGEPKKLRRITRACDYCHKRSIRCKFPGEGDPNRCKNCIDFDQPCLFDRVVKRRGAKPRSHTQPSTTGNLAPNESDLNAESACTSPSTAYSTSTSGWTAPQLATHSIITGLVDVYFEIVYPIFPFFHKPTFTQLVASGEYSKDKFSFAAVMAMCALVTARIADYAVYNPHWNLEELTGVNSAIFHAAAVRECGSVGSSSQAEFDLLRACALLAITAIQYGNVKEFQIYLGKYHVLVAMDGLHDEKRWPANISYVEIEERRRLFWSMYSLDIYSAVIWNGLIRCRELDANVSLPTEIDDEFFDDDTYNSEDLAASPFVPISEYGATQRSTFHQSSSWLCGWNFIINLYQVMENIVTDSRGKSRPKGSFVNIILSERPHMAIDSVKANIMAMYEVLPQCFKETQPLTFNESHDRFSFQATNIVATMQLLRMVILSNDGANIEDQCEVASEVVDTFKNIPVQYLLAISSPLFHLLAGIGSRLFSARGESLSESDYLQIRSVLLELTQLLEDLEHSTHHTACAEKLRGMVAQIDDQMARQQQGIAGLSVTESWTNNVSVNSSCVTECTCTPYASNTHLPIINNRHETYESNLQPATFTLASELFDDWPRSFEPAHFASH